MPEIPIKYLKYIDNTGNVQKAYGITVLKAVYDADGNTLDEILQTYDNKVGDTSSLTTTANTDLVSAINEVDGNVGDLSGLSTTAKNNLVEAVNELNQKIFAYKISIYDVAVTTQYSSTIGYTGRIDLSSQIDFPGLDKIIAAIPLGAGSVLDSDRVAIIGNVGSYIYQINATQSENYRVRILYLYKQ